MWREHFVHLDYRMQFPDEDDEAMTSEQLPVHLLDSGTYVDFLLRKFQSCLQISTNGSTAYRVPLLKLEFKYAIWC